MSNKQTEKITDELKSEVLTYWRDTAKDKDALCRTADLFGLREEDVKRIIAVRWKEKKKFWDEDKVFRLRAYMAQGMKNADIAKQLGCKPQAVADFKRRCKVELGLPLEISEMEEVKKEEPLTLGDVKDSKKKSDVEVDSSVDNYSMKSEKCQECRSESGDDDVTTEMYNDLYTRFLEMWNKCNDASDALLDVELILRTAKYAGIQWCEVHGDCGAALADCCRMYDMLISRALGDIEKIRKMLEE